MTDSQLGEVVRLNSEGRPSGTFGRGVLARPTGIARDPASGVIYVADTVEHDIKLFDAGGTLRGTLGGPGRQPGRFNTPTHLSFQGDRLYVADTLNSAFRPSRATARR